MWFSVSLVASALRVPVFTGCFNGLIEDTGVVRIFPYALLLWSMFVLRFYACGSVGAGRLVQVAMPLAESPPWRRKATDFFSTSSKFGRQCCLFYL